MKKENDILFNKWALILSGSEADLYHGFEYCYEDLYRLGLYLYKDPELVKESIQLLFIELWKMSARTETIANPKEYVLTIFKRIMYKQKTGSKKHWSALAMIDDTTDIPSIDSYEDMLIEHQESARMKARLLAVLPQLAGRQKELIWMRYFEERSIDDIARLTALTSRTIYNTLHNALVKLRELMD